MTPAAALALSAALLVHVPLGPPEPLPFGRSAITAPYLRDFQSRVLADVAFAIENGARRVLVQMPTGAGKTVLASALFGGAIVPSWFVVHRKELIDQTSRKFTEYDIPHGFIASGRPADPSATINLAGVQTLVRRQNIAPAGMVVPDEAHHSTAGSWQKMLEMSPDAISIGLTATPERLDGRGLDEQFDVMVRGPTIRQLIDWGYLSPYAYYAPSRPDTSSIPTAGGDFKKAPLGALMDRPKLIGDVVEHYLRLAKGKKGIVFAASVKHSKHLAKAFCAAGVRAAHVDGDMNDDERDAIVEQFRGDSLDILVNVDLFGEGFDVPGIEYVGLARPTKSLTIFLQQVGRALRMFAGKILAIICDHAGNFDLHGWPDEDRNWSLLGAAARKAATGVNDDARPIRTCMTCFRISPSTEKACPGCGTEFPHQERAIETEKGTLVRLDPAEARRQAEEEKFRLRKLREDEERECKSEYALRQLAKQRGYKNPRGWARMKISFRKSYRRKSA